MNYYILFFLNLNNFHLLKKNQKLFLLSDVPQLKSINLHFNFNNTLISKISKNI